jgi:hypothetical protein
MPDVLVDYATGAWTAGTGTASGASTGAGAGAEPTTSVTRTELLAGTWSTGSLISGLGSLDGDVGEQDVLEDAARVGDAAVDVWVTVRAGAELSDFRASLCAPILVANGVGYQVINEALAGQAA